MPYQTDIDLDFYDRRKALEGLPFIPARVTKNGEPMQHGSGVYFHGVPVDPIRNICAIDYKEAEERGWFKIDFLNNSLYQGVESEEHLTRLLSVEPDWLLLEDAGFVSGLSHLRDHYQVVRRIRPKSVEDIAIVLALIRPGKKHLVSAPRHEIDEKIWQPDPDGYTFKRAHALAYAMGVVVQMNLACEKMAQELGIDFYANGD